TFRGQNQKHAVYYPFSKQNSAVTTPAVVMQRISRLKRELQLLSAEPPPGVSCWQTEGRVDELQAQIVGGANTPYEGGVFTLEINIPERSKGLKFKYLDLSVMLNFFKSVPMMKQLREAKGEYVHSEFSFLLELFLQHFSHV
ncbi:hypothetical protein cypCar_00015509, partial [Cyprinus carpio]